MSRYISIMADALGTVINVIDVVNKAIDVFHQVINWPDQMRLIGQRMERLNKRLADVEAFLRTQTIDASRTDSLIPIVENIREDSQRVRVLFEKWKNDIGPFNLQFRFKPLTQAFFALGSNADELRDLSEELNKHRLELGEELAFLTVVGVNNLQVLLPPDQGQSDAQGASAGWRPPTPSLSTHSDCNILFVDPYNTGRGIVAEGYMKLLREWTVRTGGDWRVRLAHSAGFFVRNRSGVTDLVEGMSYLYPSYNLGLEDGNKPPDPTALAALFDNELFNYPYKQDVRRQVEARHSRGLAKTTFKTYDFILVFTDREYDNLVQLRRAMIARDGKAAVTGGGKGRVVRLGSYMTPGGTPQEILGPKGGASRERWDAACRQIKTAVKGFLALELRWEQPTMVAQRVSA